MRHREYHDILDDAVPSIGLAVLDVSLVYHTEDDTSHPVLLLVLEERVIAIGEGAGMEVFGVRTRRVHNVLAMVSLFDEIDKPTRYDSGKRTWRYRRKGGSTYSFWLSVRL